MSDAILESAKDRQRQTGKKLKEQEKGINWKKVKKQLRQLKDTDIVAFNQAAREYFIHFVREELLGSEPNAKVKVSEVIREASYEIGVSPETIKRYIQQHTARRAEFRKFDGYLFLNPNYEPLDDDDGE